MASGETRTDRSIPIPSAPGAALSARPVLIRGLLPSGTPVHKGMKSGDIDPRPVLQHCYTVSDKARAIGGGVLEAILMLQRRNCHV